MLITAISLQLSILAFCGYFLNRRVVKLEQRVAQLEAIERAAFMDSFKHPLAQDNRTYQP
jgi:hypothetical protein